MNPERLKLCGAQEELRGEDLILVYASTLPTDTLPLLMRSGASSVTFLKDYTLAYGKEHHPFCIYVYTMSKERRIGPEYERVSRELSSKARKGEVLKILQKE